MNTIKKLCGLREIGLYTGNGDHRSDRHDTNRPDTSDPIGDRRRISLEVRRRSSNPNHFAPWEFPVFSDSPVVHDGREIKARPSGPKECSKLDECSFRSCINVKNTLRDHFMNDWTAFLSTDHPFTDLCDCPPKSVVVYSSLSPLALLLIAPKLFIPSSPSL